MSHNNRRLLLPQQSNAATPIPPSLQAKMAAMANRSSPGPPKGGVAARRIGKPAFSIRDIDPTIASGGTMAAGLGPGRPMPDAERTRRPASSGTPFANFSKIVDPSGRLTFSGKAILHASGVSFSNGASFSINMSQLELHEELGSGNYGTVKRVLHKPTNVIMAMKEIRLELDTSKLNAILMELDILHRASALSAYIVEFYGAFFIESCVYYCMEYMDAGSLAKLSSFQRGDTISKPPPDPPLPDEESKPCQLVWEGVPELVLSRIAGDMVRGLKFLKDELEVIHRDVKPTNVLLNKKGQVKLCDFGVSGQLERSLAKTNIGCQSYMAPERIQGESQNNLGTYTVSSDVWSLGLSIIEAAIGRYPYPPEAYANVFSQLSAIVHGDAPELPVEHYSEEARDWVARCLVKNPQGRASYAELLEHTFVRKTTLTGADERGKAKLPAEGDLQGKENAVCQENEDRQEALDSRCLVDMAAWVNQAIEFRDAKIGLLNKLAHQPVAPIPVPASAPATVGTNEQSSGLFPPVETIRSV